MRAWDCCMRECSCSMRECKWVCFHYICGGGRWGLVRVHACTLCVRAAGMGGVGESMCTPDITVYNPGSTTYIESAARSGSAAFD